MNRLEVTSQTFEQAAESAISKDAVLGSPLKPKVFPVHRDMIPESLKGLNRWVGWNWEWKPSAKKWSKPPVNARTGHYAKSNDPSTWCSFDVAMNGIESGICDGVGFVLGDVDGTYFAGVDLDDCRNPVTAELSEFAIECMANLWTYWEVSPSGTGIKGICTVSSPPGEPTKNEARTIEIYSSGRYFTVTGQWLVGSWRSVEPCKAALTEIWQKHIGSKLAKSVIEPKCKVNAESDMGDSIVGAALDAMSRIHPMEDETDGSRRLFAVACRAVEHDLSDEDAVVAIRKYSILHPFPTDWSDADILLRIRQAEKKCTVVRGLAFRTIDVAITDLAIVTPLSWKALGLWNSPPMLFRYSDESVRIERGPENEPKISRLEKYEVRHHLARAAKWKLWTEKGEKFVAPPMSVVYDVMATPNPPLPILTGIVEAPVFASDGTLQTTPGYHPASQTYYAPAEGFEIDSLSPTPTAEEVQAATDLICIELLGDFPFVGDAERANAVALLLLPFARDLIEGPTPLHLFEKPSPGTGATLLMNVLTHIALGREAPAMTEGCSEDEWRKRITAKLRTGTSFTLIDNLRYRLDSAALSSAITTTRWEDRILSTSEVTCVPVRCAWVATGNNPAVSTEISRRTVRIRMDAKRDRPWQREGFRHPDLARWVKDNRPRIVHAALTLVQAWIAIGRPRGQVSLGMFESWSQVMGGILQVAGINGFLSNANEFYDTADEEGNAWRAFLAAWWETLGTKETCVKELIKLIATEMDLQLGQGSDHSQSCALGKKLAERRDRVFNMDGEPSQLVIKQGELRQRASAWHLSTSA